MASDKLTPQQQKRIDRQHAQTVRRLLVVEALATKMLKAPVRDATARVQAEVAKLDAPTRRDVLAAVRHHGARLQGDLAVAVVAARAAARSHARDQLADDVAPLAAWADRHDLEAPPPITGSPHASELDDFEGTRTATTTTASWGTALLAGFAAWEATQDGTAAGSLDDTALDSRLDGHAVTQAFSAFGDERQAYWDGLAADTAPDDSGAGGTPDDGDAAASTAPALFSVWSAVLDRRTCNRCAALDGAIVPIGEDFKDEDDETVPAIDGGAHPRCRCLCLTTFDEDALPDAAPDDNFRIGISEQVMGNTVRGLAAQF